MSDKTGSESGNPKVGAGDSSTADNSQIDSTSRARNKTVMLTPEITGQLRSLLHNNDGAEGANPASPVTPVAGGGKTDPISSLLPNNNVGGAGWQSPQGSAKGVSVNPVNQGVTHANPVADAPPRTNNTIHNSNMMAEMNNQGGGIPAPAQPAAASFKVNPTPAPVQRARKSKVIGFLISYDSNEQGEVFEIQAGRWLLTSKPTGQEDYIMVADETISALHAIIRATEDAKIQILDQLSEFGTGVTPSGKSKEEEVAGAMVTVSHGDMVRFGKRHFVVCLVPPFKAPKKKVKEETSEGSGDEAAS